MSTVKEIFESSPETVLMDGFDEAFVGPVTHFTRTLALYDYDRCIEVIVSREGMSQEDAMEYMAFNVLGAWVGAHTPLFTLPQ